MTGRRAGKLSSARANASATPKPKILNHKNGRVSAAMEFIKIQRNFNVRGDTEPGDDLVTSIEEQGVLNPIHVRWKNASEDLLYIVDGERRYWAAKKAKWSEVPVVCHGHIDDKEALVKSLSTNEGQKPLKPRERAEGFKRLRGSGLSDKEIAEIMGCSDRTVVETLRLVDKATGPLRKATIGNGGKKVKPEEKISRRAGARAAMLPKKEHEKLAKKMMGKTTDEALDEVRKVEEKLGITKQGRKAGKKVGLKKPRLSLKEKLELIERRLRASYRHNPASRTVKAQLAIIEVLKGEKDIDEVLPTASNQKKAVVAASKKKAGKKAGKKKVK